MASLSSNHPPSLHPRARSVGFEGPVGGPRALALPAVFGEDPVEQPRGVAGRRGDMLGLAPQRVERTLVPAPQGQPPPTTGGRRGAREGEGGGKWRGVVCVWVGWRGGDRKETTSTKALFIPADPDSCAANAAAAATTAFKKREAQGFGSGSHTELIPALM